MKKRLLLLNSKDHWKVSGAVRLKPSEKAQLIDKLISTLDKSDKEIDELWAKEAEDRIDAYDQGKIKRISLEKVLC